MTKGIKMCSRALILRETQVNMKCYLIPLRMAVNQNTKIVTVGEDMRNVHSGILLTGM